MHILDLLQNSVAARATTIRVEIKEDSEKDALTLIISDNGKGMSRDMAKMAVDPFFTTRTTRKVGLGLPLLKQNAERTGGSFGLESREGKGTTVSARFVSSHPDRLVLGDVPGTIILTAASNPSVNLEYLHEKDGRKFLFSSREAQEALGGIPMTEPSVYRYLRDMITENLNEIGVRLTS